VVTVWRTGPDDYGSTLNGDLAPELATVFTERVDVAVHGAAHDSSAAQDYAAAVAVWIRALPWT
jgi:hypothetical protein